MIFHIFAPVFKKHDRTLMGTVYLTRVEKFNAAHRLWIKEWSEEENIAYFGKCANKNWHGHNYTLYVTVKGTPDPVIGFVHDAKKLSAIIKKHVFIPSKSLFVQKFEPSYIKFHAKDKYYISY